MNPLPVVQRELAQASRKPRTFVIRIASAFLGTAITGVALLSTAFGGGHDLFILLTRMAFIGCVLAGMFLTSDCLRSEKRDGTLGLLFLTDLHGYDIVLGKCVAAGWNALMALLALFPVFAVGWMLGGVTAGEFWRTMLTLALALIFSLSLGIAISAYGRGQAEGLAATAFWTLLLTLGPLAARAFSGSPVWLAPILRFLTLGLLGCCRTAADIIYSAAPNLFWTNALAVFGWSVALLGLACWLVPRRWQDSEESRGAPAGLASLLKQAGFGGGNIPGKETLVRRLLDKNPILALQARSPVIQKLAWVAAIISCVGGLLLPLRSPTASPFGRSSPFDIISVFYFTGFGLLAITMLFAWQACGFFREARRSGLLDLVATTPLRDIDILHGQWGALLRQFYPPVLFAILSNLLGHWVAAGRAQSSFGGTLAFVAWLFAAVEITSTCMALAWVGAWYGLNDDRRQLAFLKTVAAVLLPKLFFIPTCFCGGFPLLAQPFVSFGVMLIYRQKFQFGIRRILIGPRQLGERSWAPMYE